MWVPWQMDGGVQMKDKSRRQRKERGMPSVNEQVRSVIQRKQSFKPSVFVPFGSLQVSDAPWLFYIKLQQLLYFPHYWNGIGLLWCLSMFSASSAGILQELLSGHCPPVLSFTLLWVATVCRQCVTDGIQNSTLLGNKFVIHQRALPKATMLVYNCWKLITPQYIT